LNVDKLSAFRCEIFFFFTLAFSAAGATLSVLLPPLEVLLAAKLAPKGLLQVRTLSLSEGIADALS
jgi:fumarate reductase subunit D